MNKERREKGQSLVEFVIVLPILLIILAGVLDLGRLYFAYVAITDAAAEGVAYAAINPNNNAEIVERAQGASGGLVQIESDMVTVDSPVVASGAPVTVTVDYEFTTVTPLINAIVPDGVIPLTAVANGVIIEGGF
jgi:Flp pilus assembly protein TadG